MGQINVRKTIRPEIMMMAVLMEAMLPDNSNNRFWQREPRESHYVGIQESLRKAGEVFNQAGAFQYMDNKVKEEFCWKILDTATFSMSLLAQMGFLLKADLRMGGKSVDFTPPIVKGHLDNLICHWRMKKRDARGTQGEAQAKHYIDAFQVVRKNIFGAVLPKGEQHGSD